MSIMISFTNRILLAVICLLAVGCHKRVINYYVPYGFEGNVAIFHKTSASEPGGEIINYEFPDSGILYVPTALPEGDFIMNYYQENGRKGYDTLQQEFPGFKIDTARPRIYFHRTLSFMRDNVTPYQISTFYVGKKKTKDINDERIDFERKLEKMVFSD